MRYAAQQATPNDLSPFNWRGKPSIFTQDSVPVVVQRKTEAQLRREELAKRNEQIVKLHMNGVKRKDLAKEFYLNPHSIADIIRTHKREQQNGR